MNVITNIPFVKRSILAHHVDVDFHIHGIEFNLRVEKSRPITNIIRAHSVPERKLEINSLNKLRHITTVFKKSLTNGRRPCTWTIGVRNIELVSAVKTS